MPVDLDGAIVFSDGAADASEAASSTAFAVAEAPSFCPKVSVVAWPGTLGESLKRSGSAMGLSLLGFLVTGLPMLLDADDDEGDELDEAEVDDDDDPPTEDDEGGVGGWPAFEAKP